MVIYREIDEWQKKRAKERERKRFHTMSEELLVEIGNVRQEHPEMDVLETIKLATKRLAESK